MQIEVGDEPGRHDDVDRTLTKDLVGDVASGCVRIPDFGNVEHRPRLRDASHELVGEKTDRGTRPVLCGAC